MGAFDSGALLFCAWAVFAGPAQASLFRPSGELRPVYGRAEVSLQSLYAEGVRAMDSGRLTEAERSFLGVLDSDPGDWDARERLAVLYQRENRLRERDMQLDSLRKMIAKGAAWRHYIWRDQFVHRSWRIMAVEAPTGSLARKRKFLFAISDSGDGRFISLVTVSVRPMDGGATLPAGGGSGAGIVSEAQSGNRRKVYRIPSGEPRFSDSVRILEKFLEGI